VARALRRRLPPPMRRSLRRLPPVRAAWERLARREELGFWRRALADGRFAGDSHERFFTTHFGLEPGFYEGKRLLDVGCGPRRRLDWATMADERVGLDPLADRYRELIGENGSGATTYLNGVAEQMPFENARFDVISCFNALDHVRDVTRAAAEIKRVLCAGGTFLLMTELGHPARLTEPQEFGWEVTDLFAPELELVYERRLEDTGHGIDRSVEDGIVYDEARPPHPGVLVARFEKRPAALSRAPCSHVAARSRRSAAGSDPGNGAAGRRHSSCRPRPAR
jgi:SAM-dependent methyltransferase